MCITIYFNKQFSIVYIFCSRCFLAMQVNRLCFNDSASQALLRQFSFSGYASIVLLPKFCSIGYASIILLQWFCFYSSASAVMLQWICYTQVLVLRVCIICSSSHAHCFYLHIVLLQWFIIITSGSRTWLLGVFFSISASVLLLQHCCFRIYASALLLQNFCFIKLLLQNFCFSISDSVFLQSKLYLIGSASLVQLQLQCLSSRLLVANC